MIIRKAADVPFETFSRCHEGEGDLFCQSMLPTGASKTGIAFFHKDELEPGVSIGEHPHEGNEEIYYLLKGECTLIFDGAEYPMRAGDISLVSSGHSHGIKNAGPEPAELIVICVS